MTSTTNDCMVIGTGHIGTCALAESQSRAEPKRASTVARQALKCHALVVATSLV
jgi:hypothetical protein